MPVIGITRCSRPGDYEESVRRAGGEPIILEWDQDPAAALHGVDGVVLTGGLDVDPARFGEAPHPSVELADAARDAFEIALAQRAVASDVPILAICRGAQVLNVALGGALVQDIPSSLATSLTHSLTTPPDAVAHDVAIAPGTSLARLIDSSEGRGGAEMVSVNSRHHQSVDRIGEGLVVAASSPDGVIEAIERPTSSFCIGVQWHPENFWRTGEFRTLFEGFVAACTERRRPR